MTTNKENIKRIISDPEEIVSVMNQLIAGTQTKYYVLESNTSNPIISNVPNELYNNKTVIRYKKPKLSKFDLNKIQIIKESLDFVHEKGFVSFDICQCYNNSQLVYSYLKDVHNRTGFENDDPIKIVFGIYSHSLVREEIADGLIIENNLLKVHDWHLWNYYNKWLIDVTIFKNYYSTEKIPENWGCANEHIFVDPLEYDEYHGIGFDSIEKCNTYLKKFFS